MRRSAGKEMHEVSKKDLTVFYSNDFEKYSQYKRSNQKVKGSKAEFRDADAWKVTDRHEDCVCHDASKKRVIECVESFWKNGTSERKVTDERFCASEVKPFVVPDPCPELCPHTWIASSFSQCSALCGGGLMKRDVHCGHKYHPFYRAASELCFLEPKPATTRKCALIDCRPYYLTSNWSKACQPASSSTHCGFGYNTRDLGCFQRLADGTTVQSDACSADDKPMIFRDCFKKCPGLAGFNVTLLEANSSRIYFVKEAQNVSLICNIQCHGYNSKELKYHWQLNGENLVQSTGTKQRSYVIQKFDPDVHAGFYKCYINIPENCSKISDETSPLCVCPQELNFTLITANEEIAKMVERFASSVSNSNVEEFESAGNKPEDENCYKNNCTIQWITSPWPSNSCNETTLNSSKSDKGLESALCSESEERLVWCGVENEENMIIEDSSNCDPTKRPVKYRECLIQCQ
ncbi:protein madd-4-like [Convolutriloba macropyga]|uniref:protein madd-4-like n=1 Tax=Convolutriloba macropyga TaxID=536237 RepID=UPI003F51EC6E